MSTDTSGEPFTREEEEEEEESYDDMPDLESVKSSEYFNSTDNEEEGETGHKMEDDIKEYESANFLIAKNWLHSGDIFKDFQVLIIYTYSPFLYGDHVEPSYWDSQWFVWFRNADLISERPFNLNELSIRDFRVLEVFGLTLEWCWKAFGPTHDASYLAAILDFWDQVKDNKNLESVIAQAFELNWFVDIIDHIEKQPDDLGLCNKQFNGDLPHSIELCILYAVCHLGYQLVSKTGGNHKFHADFDAKIKSSNELHSNDIANYLERAEVSFLIYLPEYIEHYQNALRLSPFEKSLYESRLQSHLMSSFYLATASDSIRILCLQKDHKEAHFCLIKSLCELNEVTRSRIARNKFNELFPSPTDRETLERFLRNEYELTVSPRPLVNNKNSDEFKSLQGTARMGTDYFKEGDYDNAHLFFGVCLKKARDRPGWRLSLTWKEGVAFVLAIQFCYAQTLLHLEKYSFALENFISLRRYYKLHSFPAAHLYAAICFIKQRRHIEAMEYIGIGLKVCESCGYSSLHWPGTTDPISECLPQTVKMKLLQLQAQLLWDTECIATCRYPQCLNHNITTRIDIDNSDFKGYYLLKCSEKCCVTFHPSCWKRQKNSLFYTSDKGVLSQSCVTPDCPGVVTHVILYDDKGKSKNEVVADELKSQQGDTKSSHTDTKSFHTDTKSSHTDTKSSQNHSKKSKVSRTDSGGSGNSDTPPTVTSNNSSTTNTNKPVNKPVESVQQDKPKQDHAHQQQQPIVEDLRNSEDSVGVIDRASEEKETKVKTKSSKKKKNKLSREEDTPKENGCHWNDLFSLPQREGLMGESDTSQEFPSWEPDPANPFTVPEHLKEKVSEFEGKKTSVESKEVGRVDSTHRTIQIPTPGEEQADSTIYDFIISFFVEIFKEHGPFQLLDAVLVANLESLAEREEFLKAVKPYGGLGNFLKNSPNFLTFQSGPQTMIGLKGEGGGGREDNVWKTVEKGPKKGPGEERKTAISLASKGNNTVPSLSVIAKELKTEKEEGHKALTTISSSGTDIDKQRDKADNKSTDLKTHNSIPSKTHTQNSIPSETHTQNSVPSKTCAQKSISSKTQKSFPPEREFLVLGGASTATKVLPMMDKGTQCSPITVTTNSATQTINTDKIMVTKSVGTPPLPVVESFKERYQEMKERYDVLMKEKKSADSKLRLSEDQRAKQTRLQTKEIEKSIKKCQTDMKKEMDSKLAKNEELMKEERDKFQRERKEINEQLKQAKNELKQLNDKLNKLKKDLQKKEKEKADVVISQQEEREDFAKKISAMEDQHKRQLEVMQQRAIDAEVLLLTQRKESYVKPTEQKIQELERLCTYASQALPGGEPELNTFKDQMVQTLDTYKSNMDEHIDQLNKRSHELNQLENTAPPVSHMSPQLRIKAQLVQRSLIMSLQRSMTGLTGIPPPTLAPPTAPPTAVPNVSTVPPPGLSVSMAMAPPTLPPSMDSSKQPSVFPSANPSEQVIPGMGLGTGLSLSQLGTSMVTPGMGPLGTGMGPPGTGMGPPGTGIGPPGTGIGPPGTGMGPPGTGMRPPGTGMGTTNELLQSAAVHVPTGVSSLGGGDMSKEIDHNAINTSIGPLPSIGGLGRHVNTIGQSGMNLQQGGMGMSLLAQGGMGMNLVGQGGIGMGTIGGGMGMNPLGGMQGAPMTQLGRYSQQGQTGTGMNLGGMGMSLFNPQTALNQPAMTNSIASVGGNDINTAAMKLGLNLGAPINTSAAVHTGMSPIGAPIGTGMNPIGTGMGPVGTGMNPIGTGMGPVSAGMNPIGTGMGPVGTGMGPVGTGMGPVGTGMGPVGTGMGTGMIPSSSIGGGVKSVANSNLATGGGTTTATAVSNGTIPPLKPSNEKKNFDQLVSKLSPLYPSYTRDDFKRAVLELRKTLSLTGLPLEAVIEKVKEIIDQKEGQKLTSLPQMSVPAAASANQLPIDSFAFSQPMHLNQGPMFRTNIPAAMLQSSPLLSHKPIEYNTDNNCIICYEDMFMGDSTKLECGHRFHSHCIRSWLNEQSTCPTCRKHALLVEDFPRLH